MPTSRRQSVLLPAAFPDRYLLVAAQESAGAAVSWAARTLGFGEGAEGLRALEIASMISAQL